MSLDLILSAAENTFSLIVLLLIVWVWGRATNATRLFSIGLLIMIALDMFKPKLAVWFLISIESPLWGIFAITPYFFFTVALVSEFGWRVVTHKKRKKR
ncbi:MAG: hypothetical protein ACRCVN_07285 [Spirochaetia bacterium]